MLRIRARVSSLWPTRIRSADAYDRCSVIRFRPDPGTTMLASPEGASRDAISASVARNRPLRSSGGSTASIASSFSVGSARRYASVERVVAWPSQIATLRTSCVAPSITIAQLCRSWWGVTFRPTRLGHVAAAARTALLARTRIRRASSPTCGVEEQFRRLHAAGLAHREPGTEVTRCLSPERQQPLATTLADDVYAWCRAQRNVFDLETH